MLALTIVYEVGEIECFRKVGNFTSYCRLVKTALLSADKRNGSGNRRNGNPYLSRAFSETANHAIKHHTEAKSLYQSQGLGSSLRRSDRLDPDGWLVRSYIDTEIIGSPAA